MDVEAARLVLAEKNVHAPNWKIQFDLCGRLILSGSEVSTYFEKEIQLRSKYLLTIDTEVSTYLPKCEKPHFHHGYSQITTISVGFLIDFNSNFYRNFIDWSLIPTREPLLDDSHHLIGGRAFYTPYSIEFISNPNNHSNP